MPSILQPQSRTERLYLEQMAISHWLLARFAKSERRIYRYELPRERELPLLDRVSAQRTRLERSFTSAMRDLKQLQKERQARTQPQPIRAKPAAKAASAPDLKPVEPRVDKRPQLIRT